MKSRTKPFHKQPTAVKKKQLLFNRLQGMLTLRKQPPAPVPFGYPTIMLEQSLPQRRAIELEVRRRQEAGLTYANMLPPR